MPNLLNFVAAGGASSSNVDAEDGQHRRIWRSYVGQPDPARPPKPVSDATTPTSSSSSGSSSGDDGSGGGGGGEGREACALP